MKNPADKKPRGNRVRICLNSVLLQPVLIYLVGYMASGKSNLGSELAGRLNYAFTDLDWIFEERYHISILDFFQKYDEPAFRNIEAKLLRETMSLEDTVISTGGGTPCFHNNMAFIREAGKSVYLRWDIPDIVARLKIIRRKRPLLKDIEAGDLEQFVKVHLAEREHFYLQADLIFEGAQNDLDHLARQLMPPGL
jgi:shikimate kinase